MQCMFFVLGNILHDYTCFIILSLSTSLQSGTKQLNRKKEYETEFQTGVYGQYWIVILEDYSEHIRINCNLKLTTNECSNTIANFFSYSQNCLKNRHFHTKWSKRRGNMQQKVTVMNYQTGKQKLPVTL